MASPIIPHVAIAISKAICCTYSRLLETGEFETLTRNYIERNQRIIESEFVSTTDSRTPIVNHPTLPFLITPWSPTDEIFSLR
jgi:hypothetical protein